MSLKILDYRIHHPFGGIFGKERHLAWPVDVYRVTLPRISEDGRGINPFERIILKMLDAGVAGDADVLARETFIPHDLVQCILLRLQDKAFIDEYCEIITQKRDDWEDTEEKAPVFVAMLLFRETATGKFLPFLHQLDDAHPLKKKEEPYSDWTVRYDSEWAWKKPSTRDVIAVYRAMKKRTTAFGNEARFPSTQQVAVANEPEQYYLDCRIAIQKNDGEFRIADPFGNGFSLVLESAFERLLEQDKDLGDWFLKWKHGLKQSPAPGQSDSTAQEKEPYDHDANWKRYRKLLFSLRRHELQHRSIRQIQAAIEWALFYACVCRPFETAVNLLQFEELSRHPDLLKAAAEKIGLVPPKNGFREVFPGKLVDFRAGKAGLGTVLAISLLMASEDITHPLRRVAERHPDFVEQVLAISKKRNPIEHGKGKAQKNEVELPEESFMREIVSLLLPEIRFSDTLVLGPDKDVIAERRFDARVSIQEEFGFEIFNRLGTNIQDRLIHAERFWLTCGDDGGDALVFASDLYAALQALFERLPRETFPEIQDSEFVTKAMEKAVSAGLGPLPESLSTVKPSYVRQALQVDSPSLGAGVLAFLLSAQTDTLHAIAEIQSSFLPDVAELIASRGHGNEPLPLQKNEIGQLRKSTYSTFKTLLET